MSIVKVIKLVLLCDQYDKDNNYVDYQEINKILWKLQKQTREIKNKSIHYCWEYSEFSSDYYKKYNDYPDIEKTLSYKSIDGYVNDRFKQGNDLYSANCSTTIRNACREFKNSQMDFIKGTKSVISYKQNQPLELNKKSIDFKFNEITKTFFVNLSLLNKDAKKRYNFLDSKIHFKIIVSDKSTRTILRRINKNEYKVSASKLLYNKKKKYWMLYLSYSFDKIQNNSLEKDKILGVDLGIHYPICASVYGDKSRFIIHGGEIEEFRKRIEARKISLLKQGKYCGDGRKGHGIKTRNKPVYNIQDKIARFRDTTNHKYSRALVDFAIKNNCGIIQMENLKGISAHSERFLKNWSYYDLQSKIEYKCKEVGIKVVYVDPNFTSQRCSKCGYINSDNRKTQSRFSCQNCGFNENADYNASQNIGINNIDKIIKEKINMGANKYNTL